MTKETNTIKNENPAINVVDYSTHTKHFKKAMPFTYNYAIIDGILMEMYDEYTIKQTASILNESKNRIAYRVAFLQKNHPDTIVFKRGVTIDKGTHKVSNVGQSKRKVNG
jgi:hypothetical protein